MWLNEADMWLKETGAVGRPMIIDDVPAGKQLFEGPL